MRHHFKLPSNVLLHGKHFDMSQLGSVSKALKGLKLTVPSYRTVLIRYHGDEIMRYVMAPLNYVKFCLTL